MRGQLPALYLARLPPDSWRLSLGCLSLPSPLSATPGLGHTLTRTPWIHSYYASTSCKQAAPLPCGRLQAFETSTWVSVQDVVLNKLRPSTQPSQPLPELSHFYHTSTRENKCLLMSLWFLLVCHSLTQNRCGVASYHLSANFTKAIKNTCRHKKSLHQDVVCLFE